MPQPLRYSAGPSAPPTAPLYDFSGLGRLAHDPAFVRSMMQLFLAQTPQHLRDLHEALQQENRSAMAEVAHSLKAMLGNLRIEPGASLLNQLEQQAEGPALPSSFQPQFTQINQNVQQVIAQFRQALDSAPAPL